MDQLLKIKLKNYWILFSIVFLLFSTISKAQNKRALLIGVGRYKDPAWKPLAAQNDIEILEEIWEKQGFLATPLINEKATKKGIVDALTNLSLSAKSGDFIIIHFSGHGRQITDTNGDEIDCKDEALVPYDAPKNQNTLEAVKLHLLDDEFDALLQAIQIRIGKKGLLLVFLDSCHSGSGTRAGNDDNFESRQGPLLKLSNSKECNVRENQKNPMLDKASNESPRVVYTAVQSNQIAYELRGRGGKLSLGVRDALLYLTPNSTYESIFASINSFVHANAHENGENPTMEDWSNLKKERFLGGKYKIIPIYEWIKFKNTIINSIIALANRSDNSFTPEQVISSNNNQAQGFAHLIYSNVTEHIKVKIKFDSSLPLSLKKSIQTELDKSKISKLSEYADLNLRYENGSIILDDVRSGLNYGKASIEHYEYLIEKYFYYKWLMQTEVLNPDIDVTMTLKKADWDPNSVTPILTNLKFDKEAEFETDSLGFIIHSSKEHAILKIKNSGPNKLFFCLLDIQPDGKIRQNLPERNRPKENLFIDGHSEIVLPLDYPGEPWGIETFLLVTSKVPLDLAYFTSENVTTRSATEKDNTVTSLDFATFKYTYRISQKK